MDGATRPKWPTWLNCQLNQMCCSRLPACLAFYLMCEVLICRGAQYCRDHVCLSLCIHITGTTWPKFRLEIVAFLNSWIHRCLKHMHRQYNSQP